MTVAQRNDLLLKLNRSDSAIDYLSVGFNHSIRTSVFRFLTNHTHLDDHCYYGKPRCVKDVPPMVEMEFITDVVFIAPNGAKIPYEDREQLDFLSITKTKVLFTKTDKARALLHDTAQALTTHLTTPLLAQALAAERFVIIDVHNAWNMEQQIGKMITLNLNGYSQFLLRGHGHPKVFQTKIEIASFLESISDKSITFLQ